MVPFIPSYHVGSLFLPLADPMLAEPSIPTRGKLISSFFSLNSWSVVSRSVYSYSTWVQPRSGTSRSVFRALHLTRYPHPSSQCHIHHLYTWRILGYRFISHQWPWPFYNHTGRAHWWGNEAGKSAGPGSYSCSCILVWNSVKDYWEWFYGSVGNSITKLRIGMLLSIASPKSVRAQGRTFTSWSEGFDDFVQYSSFLGCLCGSDASNLLIGASVTLAGL